MKGMEMPEDNTPEFVRFLEEAGAPREMIEEARNGYLRQRDYTTKRQKESERLRQMEQQLAFLTGRLQNSGNGAESARKSKVQEWLDDMLSEIEDPAAREQVRKAYGGFSEALQSEIMERVEQREQGLQQRVSRLTMDQELDRYYTEKLLPVFGEGIKEYWPELKARSRELLAQGQHVVPESMFLSEHPDEAAALMAERHKGKQQEQSAAHTEGMTRVSRTQPPGTGYGRPHAAQSTINGGQSGLGMEQPPPPERPNAQQLAKEIMAEIGARE